MQLLIELAILTVKGEELGAGGARRPGLGGVETEGATIDGVHRSAVGDSSGAILTRESGGVARRAKFLIRGARIPLVGADGADDVVQGSAHVGGVVGPVAGGEIRKACGLSPHQDEK